MKKPSVYISGALTDVPNVAELKAFYEAIADLCTELGFEPYLPHKHSDPVVNANITPTEVDKMDRSRVEGSTLTLLYAGVPSFGPGIEVEIANKANRPVVVFYETDRKVSRLLLGNPAVKISFTFTDFENALSILRGILTNWMSWMSMWTEEHPD